VTTTTNESRAAGVGERLRERRVQLGLTREEAARRAGVAPGYLAYLEEQGGAPSGPVLTRLAHALRSDARALAAAVRHPAGSARRLETVDEDGCWALLGGSTVGRVALIPVDGPPLVHLVNFAMLDRRIVIRTSDRSQLAYAARALHAVSFECDHVDESDRTAWSVLVLGTARAATADQAARLHVDDLVEPWPGDERRAVVTIHPDRVTGRRIVPDYHVLEQVLEPYEGSPS
jgi:nitroimidazol reductase NimA-like FMN-containing flavoprotein (pyridoxamine 5'-phosphate oxidase superfamily)